MRIGFDIDGVLANFIPAYQRLTCEITGRNLFHPNDDTDPPCWNWPEYRGYTATEMARVWSAIKKSPDIWLSLQETPHCSTLRLCVFDLQRFHDVYFVTNRPGLDAKWQTEQWLILHLGIERPTVLISSMKGLVAKVLKLDCYLDDNLDNANDVILVTHLYDDGKTIPTRMYLLNKSYNHNGLSDCRITRVDTLGQFLDKELVNL